MSEIQPTKPIPQFGTAEYTSPTQSDTCKLCKQPITGMYYRANGAMVCGSCADRVKRELPQDSHAAFVRAFLFGLGGFAIGLGLYAGFVIATGISLGYVSLAVGWIVGKAMMLGSKGIGGRRYQITAVLLTYAAVSMAFVPIYFYYVDKEKPQQPTVQQQQVANPPASDSQPRDARSAEGQSGTGEKAQAPSLARALGFLVLWGLASPFLRLESNPMAFIGLIILFVGMQFAWKMTAGRPKVVVDGPFQNSTATSA